MLMFGDAMSIFARSTCAPSGNSPARMRANRSRFSATGRGRGTGCPCPAAVSVPRYSRISSGGQAVDVGLALSRSAGRRSRRAARSSRRRRTAARPSRSRASGRRALIESTYSTSSFVGLVSSKRRLQVPPNSARDAEVQADRLGVADVQVAVRLRRETGGNPAAVLPDLRVGGDDGADEVEARLFAGRF